MSVKITSWNVNGIRACYKKGFLDWLESDLSGDIICLQETKANTDQVEKEIPLLLKHTDYSMTFVSGVKKGYSGVALITHKKLPQPKITIGLGIDEFDDEGRTIIAEYPDFILLNGYFPNGGRDLSRVPYKLRYSFAVAKKIKKLQKATGKTIIVTGDYNTAHKQIDLKNPKANKKSTGFLPEEREFLDFFESEGMIDTVRYHHPTTEGIYSWWTYRGDCRARNIGWRIDYFFIDAASISKITKAYHSPEVMGSDHCPLHIELK